MALIKCPECGQNISSRASACPFCGCPDISVSAEQAFGYASYFWDRKDDKNYVYWSTLAAEKGEPLCAWNLYVYFEEHGDFTSANKWLELSANLGFVDAQCRLGICFADGTNGYSVNYGESVRWLEAAANQDDVVAMIILGDFYTNGEGVEQNIPLGRTWWEKAADKEDTRAMNRLAQMFLDCGNQKEAYFWLTKSERLGDDWAKTKMLLMSDGGEWNWPL